MGEKITLKAEHFSLKSFFENLFKKKSTASLTNTVGEISYFEGSCPKGWAAHSKMSGRAIIPAGSATDTNSVTQTFAIG